MEATGLTEPLMQQITLLKSTKLWNTFSIGNDMHTTLQARVSKKDLLLFFCDLTQAPVSRITVAQGGAARYDFCYVFASSIGDSIGSK